MSIFLSAAKKMSLWYGLIAAATLLLVPVVASATTIGNSITVTNDATINGNVTTTNATSSGYMDIGGKLANFNASYTNGDLNVGNQLAVDGAVYASSTLEVSGVAIFWSTVRSSGNDQQALGAYGNAWANFFVSGTSFIDGVSSTSGLYPTVNNSYDIGDYNQAWNDVFASGTVRIGDTVTRSQGSAAGDVNIGNNLVVDGTANVSSTLQVTGAVRLYGALTADGLATVAGVSTTAGIYPNANNTLDLGGFGSAFNEIFASGTVRIGDTATLSQGSADGDVNIGNNLVVDGTARVSSTLQVTGLLTLYNGVSTTGGIYPTTNNAIDLGGRSAAWRDVFVSSSLTIGTVSTTASSTAIIGVLSNLSAPIDFTDMASSSAKCTDSSNTAGGDVTVTSSVLGDQVTVAPTVWDDAFTSGTLHAFVQAMNKVRIIYCGSGHDVSSQDRDPASQRYRVTVWKF